MAHRVKPVPEGYHTATPVLLVDNAARALEFYSKALGAKELSRWEGPDGRVLLAEFQVGDSIFRLATDLPEKGSPAPHATGGNAGGVWLYLPDVDAAYRRATAAGATSLAAPTNLFYGDRRARVQDPFGHQWWLATHVEDVPSAEMEKRGKEFFAQMAKAPTRKS